VKDGNAQGPKLSATVSLYDEGLWHLYRGYGIDGKGGAMVICRPDQHIYLSLSNKRYMYKMSQIMYIETYTKAILGDRAA
jgi:hypothetical protein